MNILRKKLEKSQLQFMQNPHGNLLWIKEKELEEWI